jgi:hypothetical protein
MPEALRVELIRLAVQREQQAAELARVNPLAALLLMR